MPSINIVFSESLPKCPHCEKELETIEKIVHGEWEKHVVYICPSCKKILSIGYNYYS
jgi:transposase-like protein